jgi:hypothetical protein
MAAFLASPTGRLLMARGRAIQFATAVSACRDVFHTQHSAGNAKGFGDALDWLASLSRCSRAPEPSRPDVNRTNDSHPIGEPDLRELLSP